jgi:hypothetical protein
MRKGFLRSVAQLLIGCLLFSQLAVAAYACPDAVSRGVQISMAGSAEADISKVSMDVASQSMSNCEDMAMGALDPQNANLCAEHCKFGQQSDQASTLTVPAAILLALYFAPLVPAPVARLRPAAATPSALVATSPPHTILHCCFRI